MDKEKQLVSEFKIKNALGLHARPAAMLVETASAFKAEVLLEKDGETVNGKSLMSLLMLSAGHGTVVRVIATGDDADAAVEAIAQLFHRKFDEE